MPMHIFAMIAGLDDFAPGVVVEPLDTIAELLDKMQKKLQFLSMPDDFTDAYSLVHTRPEGLREEDPDNIALEQGDPIITAKYLTPAARLDSTKTVRDYFGTRVEPETASIALVWPPETLALVKQEREDVVREVEAQWAARERAQKLAEMGLRPLVTDAVGAVDNAEEEDEEAAAVASSWSPWHWFSSCLSTRPTSPRERSIKVRSKNAKRKID